MCFLVQNVILVKIILLLCELRGTSEELNFQKRTLQIRKKRDVRFEVLMEFCINV
jgi:hypothetical protein